MAGHWEVLDDGTRIRIPHFRITHPRGQPMSAHRISLVAAAGLFAAGALLAGCSSPDPTDATSSEPVPTSSGWETTGAQALESAGADTALHACPEGGAGEDYSGWSTIWGDGVYTDDTWVCLAAIHSGVITEASGGLVVVTAEPGQDSYVAIERNGVQSNDPGVSWPASFSVSDPEGAVASTAPGAAGQGASASENTSENASDAGAATSVCSLLTVAEIDAATGVAFADGEIGDSDEQCIWQNAAGASLPTVSVVVQDTAAAQPEAQRRIAEGYGDLVDVEIPGGTDAYVFLAGQALHMIVGDQFVSLQVAIENPPTLDLAALVAGRL